MFCTYYVLQVELEGLWENPNGIPSADIYWLKQDTERGPITGLLKR